MWGFTATPSSSVILEPTDSVHAHFIFGEELGSGISGVVRKCKHRVSGQEYACKSIRKANLDGEEDFEGVRLEIAVMQKMSAHPHVVGLVAAYEDEESVHLVMEFCTGGDLLDEILRAGPFDEPGAAHVIQQLAEGLRACHEAGVIHRDIKPENMMVVRPANRQGPNSPTSTSDIGGSPPAGIDAGRRCQMQMADFGLAMFLGPFEEASGMAGSPYYMAPEILSETWYGRESDIWSLGVVLYMLLSGEFPFAGETNERLAKAILKGKLHFSHAPWPSISPLAKTLIRSMLALEPKLRPTASAVLLHPWIIQWCPNSLSTAAHVLPRDPVADNSSALPLSPTSETPPAAAPIHSHPQLDITPCNTFVLAFPPETCSTSCRDPEKGAATPSSPSPSSSSSFSPRSVLHGFSSSFNSSFSSEWSAASSPPDPLSQACFEIQYPSQLSYIAHRAQKACFGYGSTLFGSCLMSRKAPRGKGGENNIRTGTACTPMLSGSGQVKIRPSRARTAGRRGQLRQTGDGTIGNRPSSAASA